MQPSSSQASGPGASYGLPLGAPSTTYHRAQGLHAGLPGGAQLVSIQAAPNVSETGLYEAYGTGDAGTTGGPSVERYLVTTPLPAAGGMASAGLAGGAQIGGLAGGAADNGMGPGGMAQLALSLPLNVQQLGLVNTHLYSVQSMSGAQVNISPGAPGLFHLLISGSKPQVESARNLVSSILGHAIM